jgi:hypothetical protein
VEDGGVLMMVLSDGEDGLLSIRKGEIWLGDQALGQGVTILLPPAEGARSINVTAIDAARLEAAHAAQSRVGRIGPLARQPSI